MLHQGEKLKRKINILENIERRGELSAEYMLQQIDIDEKATVLDIGAGAGYITIPIAKETTGTVYALDADEDILNYLVSKAKKQNIDNIVKLVEDFQQISLENNEVDIVLASLSLHEVTDVSSVLKEIHRVLKKDGLFLCVEFEVHGETTNPRIGSKKMEEALIEAGFIIKEKVLPESLLYNESIYMMIAQK